VVPEAKLSRTDAGLVPNGEGWFVLNARDAPWFERDKFGSACIFEGESRFQDIGLNIRVLQPGQPNCMYHGESTQEDFLVLAGECLLVVQGEERRLGQWDFVHCPPWTEHVFVGAGSGPCVILMVGGRRSDKQLRYPVEETALTHSAGVERETNSAQKAYSRYARPEPRPYREGDLP
jgi:uncharacterized cupin superfamily protein